MKKNNGTKTKALDFTRFVPTMMSLLALCFGVSAIKLAYAENFMFSTVCILLACFLDGIDGRIARFLNVSSDFGAEMDSLADLVNFGVAPGFLVYCWKMNEFELSSLAWFPVMLLACCMAIRLARFNVDLATKDQNDPLVKYFFKGVPAPAAAGLVIFPLILTFQFGNNVWAHPLFVIINTIVVALLAGGTLPTPCLKKIKIKDDYKNFFLIFATIIVILVVLEPWLAFSLIGVLYILMIIASLFVYLYFKKNKGK